jgi:hypothetical protein
MRGSLFGVEIGEGIAVLVPESDRSWKSFSKLNIPKNVLEPFPLTWNSGEFHSCLSLLTVELPEGLPGKFQKKEVSLSYMRCKLARLSVLCPFGMIFSSIKMLHPLTLYENSLDCSFNNNE